MNDVPDLRAFGMRIVHCVVATVLGLISAFAIAVVLPQGHSHDGSAFAPLFLILGMGGGLAVGWYALFDLIRRWECRPRVYRCALPVARAVRTAGARSRRAGRAS